MSVLIVGSIAYDSVASPEGSVERALGGSATYGGLSCRFLQQHMTGRETGLVGVVGNDFADEDRKILADAGLDLEGLETAEGETFRWEGAYHGAMAEAETKATYLNVFEHFQPSVPETWQQPNVVFCANLHPALQNSVLEQTTAGRMTMLDSMNLWITIAKPALLEVMQAVDLIIINDGEARMLSGDENLVRAMHALAEETNTRTLIVKRGEHGVLALHEGALLALPAVPTAHVVDPTGCGDTFAGALAAHLASGSGPLSLDELRTGLMMATVMASFTLEAFGTTALRSLEGSSFDQRMADYRSMLGL
ncbi:MAG: PfkB family carbohydrate kinase [Candidatus Thermoplasmatota archaeon]|nr:PfkB family carbohydrate kinase [Candidatus Thermoplasmatota archaeon]